MNSSFYELTWYFLIYGFFGWCLEIIYAAVKKHHFYSRGIFNGPICPIYGLGMVFSLVFFDSLKNGFLFLAIGCTVAATVLDSELVLTRE